VAPHIPLPCLIEEQEHNAVSNDKTTLAPKKKKRGQRETHPIGRKKCSTLTPRVRKIFWNHPMYEKKLRGPSATMDLQHYTGE
jgi:hypothetical protein